MTNNNRKRNLTITLRVTKEERELFLRGAEKRNMTLTDFLVSAALYKPSPAIRECKTILKKLNEVQAEFVYTKSRCEYASSDLKSVAFLPPPRPFCRRISSNSSSWSNLRRCTETKILELGILHTENKICVSVLFFLNPT